ncbi:hypothetical protein SNEBB_005848 [Seison nebaliae]|nr:hypothetical protein SNEBB_005848 [Seison nebaliae]
MGRRPDETPWDSAARVCLLLSLLVVLTISVIVIVLTSQTIKGINDAGKPSDETSDIKMRSVVLLIFCIFSTIFSFVCLVGVLLKRSNLLFMSESLMFAITICSVLLYALVQEIWMYNFDWIWLNYALTYSLHSSFAFLSVVFGLVVCIRNETAGDMCSSFYWKSTDTSNLFRRDF